MSKSSVVSGFYKLSQKERAKIVGEFACLNDDEIGLLLNGRVEQEILSRMSENVIGSFQLPLGIAVNFLINGKDYFIPMAIEEPSVVAAASNSAKLARQSGGFQAQAMESIMIGQIQIRDVKAKNHVRMKIFEKKDELLRIANECDPILIKLGGGAKDIDVRIVGHELVVHLLVDTKDAMGANVVNTMVETCAPYIEEISGCKVGLRILSNLAIHRLVRAKVVYQKEAIGGKDIVNGIVNAYEFALLDIFRCATHNKGIMNGISAVAIATGNDFRALEAGAHAYASYTGSYKPLTRWEENENGDLAGSIELPIAVGLVGGATAVHPIAKLCIKILGVKSSKELAEVMASVGLAQNFAALRALVAEGIQKGHMSLHAKNVAIMAGAKGDEIDKVSEQMVKEGKVRLDRAIEILRALKEE
ncbi:MAG: hydroxymethylglutaryl-CoA reductase, degradative [Candidatus Thermoplasmatota archaeon]